MANNLRDLSDAISDRRISHGPSVPHGNVAEVLRLLQEQSAAAVCFDGGDVGEMTGLAIIPELFRLPFETCWIEFHRDFDEGRIVFGFMARQNRDAFAGSLWHKDPEQGWSYFGVIVVKQGMREVFRGDIDDDEIELASNMIDCVGAFLSALNCTNVRRVEHKPDTKLQKARAKRGKQPLFSYWTLELDLSRPESSESLGGTHAAPRLHLRRGHPRQYAPGKYTWVQPCVVGNKASGMVHKDYRLELRP